MSLEKVKAALVYNNSTLDEVTKNLELVETIAEQDFEIEADFINDDVPTNKRIDASELKKISNASKASNNQEQLDLIQKIYDDVTGNLVPRDLGRIGFVGFGVSSEDFDETGFHRLNFDEHSGFKVTRNENDNLTFDVKQNNFAQIKVNSKTLTPKLADTLHMKGSEGIGIEASDKHNVNTLTLRNRFTTLKSLKDVDIPKFEENNVLAIRGGKIRALSLTEVTETAASVIYGGEF